MHQTPITLNNVYLQRVSVVSMKFPLSSCSCVACQIPLSHQILISSVEIVIYNFYTQNSTFLVKFPPAVFTYSIQFALMAIIFPDSCNPRPQLHIYIISRFSVPNLPRPKRLLTGLEWVVAGWRCSRQLPRWVSLFGPRLGFPLVRRCPRLFPVAAAPPSCPGPAFPDLLQFLSSSCLCWILGDVRGGKLRNK